MRRAAIWIQRAPWIVPVNWPQVAALPAQVTPTKLMFLKAFRYSPRSSKFFNIRVDALLLDQVHTFGNYTGLLTQSRNKQDAVASPCFHLPGVPANK